MSKYKATVILAEEPHKDYLGTAVIEIAKSAAIKNVIIQGARGDTIKLKFPSDELGGDDVAYPVSGYARRAMTAAVAEAYNDAITPPAEHTGLQDTGQCADYAEIDDSAQPQPTEPPAQATSQNTETVLWDEYKAVANKLGGTVIFYKPALGTKQTPIIPAKTICEKPRAINLLCAKLLKEGYLVAIRHPDGKLLEYDKVKKSLRDVLCENAALAKQPVTTNASGSSGRAVTVSWSEQLRKDGA